MPTILHKRYGKRQNAKTWANRFRARLLEPGIVSYEEQDAGKNLLQKPCLDACVHTFVGKPLVLSYDRVGRPTYTHPDKVTESNQDKFAVGYISGVEYDPYDGWWYAVGTVHDDQGKTAAREIGYVSCAFDVTDAGPGGEYHNIPYDLEILAFEGEHLAIVKSPRYETATIRLNAKTNNKTKKHMFKLITGLKKVLAPKPEASPSKKNDVAQPEETTLAEDAALEVDGEMVPVADLVASHKRVNSKDGEELDGESLIEVDGETVSINELIATRKNAKKNADEDEEDKKKENDHDEDDSKKENDDSEEEDKKKENDHDEDEMPAKKASKKNSKVYRVNAKPGPLSAARENGLEFEVTDKLPETMSVKLARGVERYGPKNVTPAK